MARVYRARTRVYTRAYDRKARLNVERTKKTPRFFFSRFKIGAN